MKNKAWAALNEARKGANKALEELRKVGQNGKI